jgi:transposase
MVTGTKEKTKHRNVSPWEDKFYLEVYLLRRNGATSKANVAEKLGVSAPTFTSWLEKRPALKEAWDKGGEREEVKGSATLREFIYGRMEPRLRRLWDCIMEEGGNPESGNTVEALLYGKPKRVRQHLFLHALTCTNFNTSKAASMVNVSMATVRNWEQTDPGFGELVEEMEEHKLNFFEDAFIERVNRGDSAAIIHAMRTKGRARGYGDQKSVDVQVAGQIDVNHTHVDITKLNLPVDVLKQVLAAMRAHMDTANVPRLPGTAISTVAVTTNGEDEDDVEEDD